MSDQVDLAVELNKAAESYRIHDFGAAKSVCESILAHIPDQPDALNVLALAERATKKWGKAEEIVRYGINAHDRYAPLHNTLGLIALDQRRLPEAEAAFRQAVECKPNKQDFRINLSRVLHEMGNLDDAKAILTSIIDEGSLLPNPFILRASISAELGKFDKACADLALAEEKGADAGDLATAKAQCAFADSDFERAYRYYDEAVTHTTDVADARVNRGMVRLLQGRINEGWNDYRMRHQRRWGRSVARPFTYPQWQGEDLAGKSLLLWAEQGLGEAILCGTLIPVVLTEAKSVTLECGERLAVLLRRSFPQINVAPQVNPPHTAIEGAKPDYQASLLDLIRYRGADAAENAPRPACLTSDADHAAELKAKYCTQAKEYRLVGLSWSSPQAVGGRMKKIDAEFWRAVLSVPGVCFVNLQYGDDRQDLNEIAESCGATFINDTSIDPAGALDRLSDQIAVLDLVVSVSTTTAHLAGALGVPTWVIVPPLGPAAMWYWFTDRTDSPWYPAIRLIRRQYGEGQDKALIEDVARDLATWSTA